MSESSTVGVCAKSSCAMRPPPIGNLISFRHNGNFAWGIVVAPAKQNKVGALEDRCELEAFFSDSGKREWCDVSVLWNEEDV